MLAAIVVIASACANSDKKQISATRAAPVPPASTSASTSTTTSTTRPRVAALPTVVDHGPRDRRAVTLTFDSNMTVDMLHRLDSGRVKTYANLAVLDYLETHHIRATFFLAGLWVDRYPGVTRRIASNPDFEIGSHSYLHLASTLRATAKSCSRSIRWRPTSRAPNANSGTSRTGSRPTSGSRGAATT